MNCGSSDIDSPLTSPNQSIYTMGTFGDAPSTKSGDWEGSKSSSSISVRIPGFLRNGQDLSPTARNDHTLPIIDVRRLLIFTLPSPILTHSRQMTVNRKTCERGLNTLESSHIPDSEMLNRPGTFSSLKPLQYSSIACGLKRYHSTLQSPLVIRLTQRACILAVKSCCHILSTRHPDFLRVLVTRRSRPLFRLSFSIQNALLVVGWEECLGHPCQKQPSTKTAS